MNAPAHAHNGAARKTAARAGRSMTPGRLAAQNRRFKGSGGISQENRVGGFLPAFADTETGATYRSCFADGSPAPIHLLDGLPVELVVARSANGRVTSVKDSVVAGFIRAGRFYTREQAAEAMTRH
ncbi:MAG TPA: hypothetical protein PLP22_12805 [Candidatus Competibacter sp.]|nr:hypothetical protein [Candidatus Competibacter sp.]HUM95849.1 hypothetical protein [Candidatus Competibacter sp.]